MLSRLKKIASDCCIVSISMVIVFLCPKKTHAAEIIKIGYFMLPPQAYVKDGKAHGTAVEYWEKYIAPEMGVRISWYGPYNLKRLFAQARKGRLDAILILAKNPERQEFFDYPQNGFYNMSAGILLHKKHRINNISSVKDLKYLKLCFFAGGHIPAELKQSKIRWKLEYESDWMKQCFHKTIHRHVDGTFDLMRLALRFSSRLYNNETESKIISIPELKMPVYTAFSKRTDKTLITRYEKIHRRLMKKNRFSEIVSTYMNQE